MLLYKYELFFSFYVSWINGYDSDQVLTYSIMSDIDSNIYGITAVYA